MRHFINIVENASSGPKSMIDVAKHFLFMHDDLLADDEEYPDFDNMDETTALAIVRRNYLRKW